MRKILLVAILFCVSLITLTGNNVTANTGTAHIMKGNFKNGANGLTYWYSPSVSTYGLSSHFEHGFKNWSTISSKVNFKKTTVESGANVKVYVGSNNLPAGYSGLTAMYSYNWLGQVTSHTASEIINGENFDQATIRIDNTRRQNAGFVGWDKVVKLASHEIGHTLSLFHFENSPSHTDRNSWMYSSTNTNSAYPSSDDKAHLKSKWGY